MTLNCINSINDSMNLSHILIAVVIAMLYLDASLQAGSQLFTCL